VFKVGGVEVFFYAFEGSLCIIILLFLIEFFYVWRDDMDADKKEVGCKFFVQIYNEDWTVVGETVPVADKAAPCHIADMLNHTPGSRLKGAICTVGSGFIHGDEE
jgi:hypothetical protein